MDSVLNVGQLGWQYYGCDDPCEEIPWYDRTVINGNYENLIAEAKWVWGASGMQETGKIKGTFRFKICPNCPCADSYHCLIIDLYEVCYVSDKDEKIPLYSPTLNEMLLMLQKELGQNIYYYFSEARNFVNDTGLAIGKKWYQGMLADTNKHYANCLKFYFPCSFGISYLDNKSICYSACSQTCCLVEYKFDTRRIWDNKVWELVSRNIVSSGSNNCQSSNAFTECEYICSEDLFVFHIGFSYSKDILTPGSTMVEFEGIWDKKGESNEDIEVLNAKSIKIYSILGSLVKEIECKDPDCSNLKDIDLNGVYLVVYFDKDNQIIKSVTKLF